MELSTEQKTGRQEEESQREANSRWGGEEVRALLVVWREREAWDEAESKAKYEAISSRLKEMGVNRDWLSCQTQSRAMALPEWRPPAIRTSMDSTAVPQRSYEMDEEQTSPVSRRLGNSSLSNFQEGKYMPQTRLIFLFYFILNNVELFSLSRELTRGTDLFPRNSGSQHFRKKKRQSSSIMNTLL